MNIEEMLNYAGKPELAGVLPSDKKRLTPKLKEIVEGILSGGTQKNNSKSSGKVLDQSDYPKNGYLGGPLIDFHGYKVPRYHYPTPTSNPQFMMDSAGRPWSEVKNAWESQFKMDELLTVDPQAALVSNKDKDDED